MKKNICFGLKNQEYNPKIKEGQLLGIAIQTWHNYVWSSCGYLMVNNDLKAIQNLEKEKGSQEYFFQLEDEVRVEEFMEDVISDEGKKLGTIGKKKIYIEDPGWGKKIKLIYPHKMQYFVLQKVVKNENSLLHVEIEPMKFLIDGVIDKLIFKGEKINQYRNLIVENLEKEFKVPLILDDLKLPIDTNRWGENKEIELVEKKTGGRPEKSYSEVKQSLKKYYRNNDIKAIKLSDEDKNLDIFFNSGKKKSSNDFSSQYDKQKIEQAKIYLKSNNKKTLDYLELNPNPPRNSSEGNGWMVSLNNSCYDY